MTTACLQSLGYLPVAAMTLRAGAQLDVDLHIQHSGRAFAELYRDQSRPLRSDDLAQLERSGVDHLYIRLEDTETYRDYLSTSFLNDASIPTGRRMAALRAATRVAFEDAMRTSDF